MDPAEAGARGPVSKHRLEQLVAVVAGSEAVSVGEEDPPALVLEREGLVGKRHVELAREIIPNPEIVISADIHEGDAVAPELAQSVEDADELLRDRVGVLEPEVEQVPDHVECSVFGPDLVEEGEEVPLPLPARIRGSLAEVGVGDEIDASWVRHGASV